MDRDRADGIIIGLGVTGGRMHARWLVSLLVFGTFFAVAEDARGEDSPLPTSSPKSVGFSPERLKRLKSALRKAVDNHEFAGVVAMLGRHGRLVEEEIYGKQDLASGKPMRIDTIFRLYSMTKPITGVAMMMLYEEGKWKPSDPIANFIPEFSNLEVYAGADKSGKPKVVAAAHPPTIGQLMSHNAGFSYGIFDTPVDKLYREANLFSAGSLKAFAAKLAKLPLAYQPGEAWVYSVSADLQGYLVEKLSGVPFRQFVRDRIFAPLGMKDTDFFVPPEKLARLATVYKPNEDQTDLIAVPHASGVERVPTLASGGGGLYATATDYLRFVQMLLNKGELNGVRLLAPSSIDLMRSNHLPEKLLTGQFGIGPYYMQPGLGFGYDFAIYDDPGRVGSTAGKGSYLWNGLAGTWFWIDPTNDLVFVGLVQRLASSPGMPDMENLSRALVYQALVEPSK